MEIQEPAAEVEVSAWSCPPSPPSTGWPTFPPTHFPSDTDLHYSSAEVQAWAVGNQMHLKVVHQVKKFFNSQKEHTDDDTDTEDDDEYDSDSDDEKGLDYLGFFSNLFEENEELREYYLKKPENAEFGCLACGGVGFIKRFKECVALVQHTLSISNTKKNIKAHRDFGQVLCKVLGWDINKLPSTTILNKTTLHKQTLPQVDASKLKENVQDQDGLGNDLGKDLDGNSAVQRKEKQPTRDVKLLTSDMSNLVLVQEPLNEVLSGKNESEDEQ